MAVDDTSLSSNPGVRRLCAAGLVACVLSMAACSAGGSAHADAPSSAAASSSQPASSSEVVAPQLPPDVQLYATTDAGANRQCLVGAATDETGMNQKPVVYLREQAKFAWKRDLPLPRDTFQARATHCVATANELFVLIQGDTQSEQTLSQTLLELVELTKADGRTLATRSIDVPNVSVAHTTWVEKGNGNFRLRGGSLMVTGRYALLSDRDKMSGFSISIPVAALQQGR